MNMFEERRKILSDRMGEGSLAIFFGATGQNRNGDQNYQFRQDSDFWYITGCDEPDAVVILINEKGKAQSHLFRTEKDSREKQWFGSRSEKDDVAGAFDGYHNLLSLKEFLYTSANNKNDIYHAFSKVAVNDNLILNIVEKLRVLEQWSQNWRAPMVIKDWRRIVHEMRVKKSPAEIVLLKEAAKITSEAINNLIGLKKERMSEFHMASYLEYDFISRGAEGKAFNTIVGGGENSCIMHHETSNYKPSGNDIVLIDAGCEFEKYAGDISRCFPINGSFTSKQRKIYQLVLDSQKQAISEVCPGKSLNEINVHVKERLLKSLQEISVIPTELDYEKKKELLNQLYPHDLGHYLGLDLHDVGLSGIEQNRALEPGMVITIEPGVYIAGEEFKGSEYYGIGIRIEDTILVTDTGCENLTQLCIKEPDDIEKACYR